MRAVILIGHGSLRPGSGAAMIRLAARLRERGIAPIAGAGFLNYSRPPFLQAVARGAARGATEIIVVPYFLVPGKFVLEDVPAIVAQARETHPAISFQLAQPFGDHPALADLICKRAAAAEAQAAVSAARRGLLIMAHGSPHPASNQPIYNLASQIEARGAYSSVLVSFMDLNKPRIDTAIDNLIATDIAQITAVPFFLQLGGHVAEDLPATISAAQARHRSASILLSQHLGYDPLLVDVIAERVDELQVKD